MLNKWWRNLNIWIWIFQWIFCTFLKGAEFNKIPWGNRIGFTRNSQIHIWLYKKIFSWGWIFDGWSKLKVNSTKFTETQGDSVIYFPPSVCIQIVSSHVQLTWKKILYNLFNRVLLNLIMHANVCVKGSSAERIDL